MSVSSVPVDLTPIKPVEVTLGVPKDVAFERTMAAFLASGLRVETANKEAGLIKSTGTMGEIVTVGGLFPVVSQTETFVRANLVSADSGTKVYLSTSGRSHTISSGKTEISPEYEMYECKRSQWPGAGSAYEKCLDAMTKYRAKLDTLATRIRTSS
jgi:hypothetical protein